ncbi:cytochrome P450 [Penicillium cataractarum]|uniref:Cytochrome P450 n=1 Tax=Penicillium cataractarum TaxID=2100454 RepID=A0A9W9R937_9EURO|nr:cytochrome P450 [Penicillium cataractarum]KAJ5354959.1 cytochrome P450 [Penicillium cataractarum]
MDIPEVDNDVIGYIHETGLAQILGTIPGMYMVDIFTWMEFLPIWLKPWEKEAKKRFQRDMRWCLERLQSQISTWSFLEAMLQNPEAQRKCRIEIDNIVGDRLPEFADLDRIPYVKCIMKEVWRWRPPVALGHPHVTTRDIIYNGYRIPKGSRIHLNSWAIGHDPRRHDDPERFWPERYIGDETTGKAMQSINSADVSKRDHFAFGAGRRICPGYNVAERSFAVAIMRILWAFEVQPAPGTQVPLDPLSYMKNAEMPGNASINLPVTLEVRSEERKKLINDIFDKMDRERTKMVST